MLPLFPDIFFLVLQIAVAAYGVSTTWRIYKIINHHNFWWVMSLGFMGFMVASILRFHLPHSDVWYGDINVLYLPLIIRILFAISTYRILDRTIIEHRHSTETEKELQKTIKKIRTMTIGDNDGT
jgi:uncharacterized membrane protein